MTRHPSFAAFEEFRRSARSRLVLLTTAATRSYLDFDYRDGDCLMFGRESAGVPAEVHAAADQRLVVPMRPGLRSINLAMTVSMVAGEALRQAGWPGASQPQEEEDGRDDPA